MDRLIESTYLDYGKDFTRACRCAVVTNIDVTTGFDPNVLVKSLATAGMPQINELHPSITNCRVVRHLVRGQSNNQVTVQIFYETPTGGDVPTGTFYVKSGTAVQSESAGIDSDGLPIYVDYKPTTGTGSSVQKHTPINRLTPLRTLQVSGTLIGLPSTASQASAVNTVNLTTWQGLPRAYWLCNGFEVESNSNGTYTISSSFISRVNRDWKEYCIFLDETGNVPQDVLTGAGASAVATVMNKIYIEGQDRVNGFTSVGFYALNDFISIFGF